MTSSEISRLLYLQWDPLGVRGSAPADEYDDYATYLAEHVSQGATADSICAYLSEVRATLLLMPPDPRADRRVAELIIAPS